MSNSYQDQKEEFTLDKEIKNTEEQLKTVHGYNNDLWFNVIVPYINNAGSSQVLTKLSDTSFDRQSFDVFMLQNNPSYIKLQQHLISLKTKQSELTKQVEHTELNKMSK